MEFDLIDSLEIFCESNAKESNPKESSASHPPFIPRQKKKEPGLVAQQYSPGYVLYKI